MNNWKEINNLLTKTFEFEEYMQGINFVNKVANISIKQDHHTDIHIVNCEFTI